MKTPTHHDKSDPDAPPSEDELRDAAELRDALADMARDHDGAALARAVVLAHSPRVLDPAENDVLVARALEAPKPMPRVASLAIAHRKRGPAPWVAAAASLAVAASVLIAQQQSEAPVAAVSSVPLHVRSAQPLFHQPFAASGGTSSRIDRIASARAADLRENMFARWDVR
jgi:hypothetical protein